MNLKQKLGRRIRGLRLKNGYTQAILAEKVDIAIKHQSCIETGKNFPSADLIEKYAIVFNVDVSEILRLGSNEDRKELIKKIHLVLNTVSTEELSLIYKLLAK